MIVIQEYSFGGDWILFRDDSQTHEIAQPVLEQLYAQMMGWAYGIMEGGK